MFQQLDNVVQVALLDDLAKENFSELSAIKQIKLIHFSENLEDVSASILFLIGDFDREETKQAVKFFKKFTNTFQFAVQLGNDDEIWANSTIKLGQGQRVFDVVNTIIQLLDDEGLVSVDWEDIATCCRGLRCKLITTDNFAGENRAENCGKQFISLSPNNVEGLVYLIRSNGSSLIFKEIYDMAEQVTQSVDEDAIIIFGTSCEPGLGDNLSIAALVAYV